MILTEYDKLFEAAQYVKALAKGTPRIGVVCGSGLGDLANILEAPLRIPYAKIPHFPRSTVEGHAGELVLDERGQFPVVFMRGRVHLYEGYEAGAVVRPIRLLAMLGVQLICVTNAAGNLNPNFRPGDFMIIRDHISFPALTGDNPLRGPHDHRLGARFPCMSQAYDTELIAEFERIGVAEGLSEWIRKGVYAQVAGPSYETVAEARAIRLLGVDAIGMSTAHEVIAAHQMGLRCFGISLLTNEVTSRYDADHELTDHSDVIEMSDRRSADFTRLMRAFIGHLRMQVK